MGVFAEYVRRQPGCRAEPPPTDLLRRARPTRPGSPPSMTSTATWENAHPSARSTPRTGRCCCSASAGRLHGPPPGRVPAAPAAARAGVPVLRARRRRAAGPARLPGPRPGRQGLPAGRPRSTRRRGAARAGRRADCRLPDFGRPSTSPGVGWMSTGGDGGAAEGWPRSILWTVGSRRTGRAASVDRGHALGGRGAPLFFISYAHKKNRSRRPGNPPERLPSLRRPLRPRQRAARPRPGAHGRIHGHDARRRAGWTESWPPPPALPGLRSVGVHSLAQQRLVWPRVGRVHPPADMTRPGPASAGRRRSCRSTGPGGASPAAGGCRGRQMFTPTRCRSRRSRRNTTKRASTVC